jgi:phage shock protein A
MEDMQRKVKGFFERPEGRTGMIFIFIGILGFLFAGNYLMPFIIAALANTLYAAFLGGTLFALIALVMNNKVRALAGAMFKSAMRALTSFFITIDPIGILKNYLDDMDERLQAIADNIGKLNGQKKKLDRTIAEERQIAEDAMHMANAAKKNNNQVAIAANARKAARSQDFIKKLQTISEKMEFLGRILMKMRNSVSFLRDDTADQIRILEMEYKSVKAAHKAMKSAEAKELFEQSAEFLAEDIANKLGEMETFMELSEGFMMNVDLQNGVWDEKGLAMLESFEQNGSLLSYEDKRNVGKVRIATTGTETQALPEYTGYETQTQTSSAMASFFNNKG